ncbi:hypothetical protein A1OQ_14830 [Enterovibrio norvegicus FF-162]|mgnify:CR=1 FL=1|uniref:hypothetical protein n=1 Tax=Enterovibrio TaxID=188143 RepID=UPI0003115E3F|nr:hypothetical protein [Enterovibrio norvegicus]OEE87571.1 hypothetical protein A1OQ_14830 [Enterovibrio norvegicus FF-162]
MAKPNKKLPTRSVDIVCGKCKALLFKYKKGGKGALVKCFKERIVVDYTTRPCTCPSCDMVFAREALVRGTPAYKIIGSKAVLK